MRRLKKWGSFVITSDGEKRKPSFKSAAKFVINDGAISPNRMTDDDAIVYAQDWTPIDEGNEIRGIGEINTEALTAVVIFASGDVGVIDFKQVIEKMSDYPIYQLISMPENLQSIGLNEYGQIIFKKILQPVESYDEDGDVSMVNEPLEIEPDVAHEATSIYANNSELNTLIDAQINELIYTSTKPMVAEAVASYGVVPEFITTDNAADAIIPFSLKHVQLMHMRALFSGSKKQDKETT
ncbi:MAG: hypothetical protein AAFQ68_06250 [Bacteroidota bacterium]